MNTKTLQKRCCYATQVLYMSRLGSNIYINNLRKSFACAYTSCKTSHKNPPNKDTTLVSVFIHCWPNVLSRNGVYGAPAIAMRHYGSLVCKQSMLTVRQRHQEKWDSTLSSNCTPVSAQFSSTEREHACCQECVLCSSVLVPCQISKGLLWKYLIHAVKFFLFIQLNKSDRTHLQSFFK